MVLDNDECHLIFLSPVHHHHQHYHFYYASLHLSSTPDSKLTFSTNLPTIVSLTLSDGSHGFLMIISELHCSLFFVSLFVFFLFDTCDRLS